MKLYFRGRLAVLSLMTCGAARLGSRFDQRCESEGREREREREEGESERERHSVKQKFTLLIPSHLRTLTPHLPHAGRRRGPLVQSSAQWQRGRKLTPRRLPSSRAGRITEVGCQQVDLEQAAELSRIKRMAYLYLITPYCDLSSRSR